MNIKLHRFLVTMLIVGSLLSPAWSAGPLQFEIARQISAPLEYELEGLIETTQKSTLSAQVSGRIEAVFFDVDDRVNAGEVIIKIRDTEYRARVEKARAMLTEAATGFADTELAYQRARKLISKKLISTASFDKIKANYQTANARVKARKAEVKEAQEQLDNTIVRAPYSGVVVKRHIELGETTHIGQPLMSGFSLENLRVTTYLPQSLINAVRLHQTARVILLDTGSSIETEELTIFPYANAETHAFQVRANLKKSSQTLAPGMLVKVAFEIDHIQRLMIPKSAVVYRSELVGVYVADERQQLSFRQVRAGDIVAGKVAILAGLSEGEKVAINPVRAGIELKAQRESGK